MVIIAATPSPCFGNGFKGAFECLTRRNALEWPRSFFAGENDRTRFCIWGRNGVEDEIVAANYSSTTRRTSYVPTSSNPGDKRGVEHAGRILR